MKCVDFRSRQMPIQHVNLVRAGGDPLVTSTSVAVGGGRVHGAGNGGVMVVER